MNLSLVAGFVSIVIGIIYSIQAFSLPRATIGNPMAPVLFPLALGLIMTLCGIVLVVMELKKCGWQFSLSKPSLSYTGKLIAYTCAVSIIYALLFEEIGYVLSTFFFMEAILFAINGKEQWKINTIVSLCFSVGIYVVFSKLLGIVLPMMPILDI
ncbi:MAG: tripartite tricarboxylate transporter TctB family protein [Peptococcaceae bacterium]|nr:tripartite tricarboxylate transporter TctB family protein [Peptococcaceae bacterium]